MGRDYLDAMDEEHDMSTPITNSVLSTCELQSYSLYRKLTKFVYVTVHREAHGKYTAYMSLPYVMKGIPVLGEFETVQKALIECKNLLKEDLWVLCENIEHGL